MCWYLCLQLDSISSLRVLIEAPNFKTVDMNETWRRNLVYIDSEGSSCAVAPKKKGEIVESAQVLEV